MGKGIDLAREEAPEHAAVMDEFKDQLLLVLMRRLAGVGVMVDLPIAEVDDTDDLMLTMSVDQESGFHLTLIQKGDPNHDDRDPGPSP